MDKHYERTLNLLNKEVRRDHRSLRNRLQSILLDHKFLDELVLSVFPNFPVVPNERCGLWYCDPSSFCQTSYFKSTDGHTNQWDFSVRRLNVHLLPTLAKYGGIVIVDSTRRGKKMPDALSKTVPIWCAVLNSLMLEFLNRTDEEVLFCPPHTVSRQEYVQIKAKIPLLVDKLKAMGVITGEELAKLNQGKILRPLWVYPGSSLLSSHQDLFTGETTSAEWESPDTDHLIPVVLCTVSYQCQDGVDNRHGFTYVQGAADDHELWAKGLTAEMLWDHIEFLRNPKASDQALDEYISTQLKAKKASVNASGNLNDIINTDVITKELRLGRIAENVKLSKCLQQQLCAAYCLVIIMSESVELSGTEEDKNSTIRVIKLSSGSKKSSKSLRAQLINLCPLIESNLHKRLPILVCCGDGKDMSLCVLLSVLCRNYNVESWELEQQSSIHKTIIRKHLSKVVAKLEGRNVNPPRASLNSVNAYLM
ncbi:LANO_0F14334g1_1 [Lachancea nothofagi CBS 11611]|uniref:LANO_0F14334g1_1 n=1 Tax=Lachancea nothofagi CBS 11611 TaxID=1266666 RepID=A0A1G4KC99_9SACH|nr:LANO_0F14334g1_1 [Lachancea nothofagi CBS 11611]